jgi:hypothetical protein
MHRYRAAEVMGPEAIKTTIPELMGHHAAEVAGAEAIVTTFLEPMGHRIRDVRGITFLHRCTTIPPSSTD